MVYVVRFIRSILRRYLQLLNKIALHRMLDNYFDICCGIEQSSYKKIVCLWSIVHCTRSMFHVPRLGHLYLDPGRPKDLSFIISNKTPGWYSFAKLTKETHSYRHCLPELITCLDMLADPRRQFGTNTRCRVSIIDQDYSRIIILVSDRSTYIPS